MRVLFLDLDTLRPDHLGCYGYHRNTSPNIDKVAAKGVRFNNYYCSDAPCLPSRTALMSGRFGIHTGVVGHGGTAADMRLQGATRGFTSDLHEESLPALFRRQGMKTVSISPFAERHSSFTFYAGFQEIHNTGKGGMELAEEVSPVALDWIQRNAKDDDWFLHINYWDPHTPYRAPADFGNPFADEPLGDWPDAAALERHQQFVGPHSAKEVMMYDNVTSPKYPRHPGEVLDMDGLRKMIDGYDCGICYMDDHIGRLFEALEAQGVMDDLVIIISADHGENFGEFGIYGEHATADYPTCRIPMIISWPGKTKQHVDDGLHYNLDLFPSLSEMFGEEQKQAWDGKSYAKTLLEQSDSSHDYLVLSQCAHVCQRSVRFGDYLYIRTYHDGYHLFADEMLFNIEDDPHQQNDLARDQRQLCHQAVYYLSQWHDKMMFTMDSQIDPLWTVMAEGGPAHTKGRLQEYCNWLEKTERSWAVAELKKRHPGES